MKRKIVKICSTILVLAIFIGCIPINVFADEISKIESTSDESNSITFGEAGGYLAGSIKTTQKLYADRNFHILTGHGFAAENGNNLYDSLKGINTKVIGGDNAKNGADRIIFNKNGTATLIQDKYYSKASRSVSAAFDTDGMYKYTDDNEMPMQLEVPADQYDEAVVKMKDKIEAGKVKNVTNPEEAENIIRKGKLTFKQAKNLTKSGNISSLKYDATTGVITAAYATGISFAINYAIALINGENPATAFSDSLGDSIKTGAVVGLAHIIVAQLSKTNFRNVFKPAGDALSKVLGKNLCKQLLTAVNVENAGVNTLEKASKLLKFNILTQAVILVVLSVPEVVDAFCGRISPEQMMANITVTASGLVGGVAGTLGGSALGSMLPGPGNIIGGVVGGIIGGAGASFGTQLLIDNFTESDAEKMCKVIQDEFEKLSTDYIISKDEADQIVEKLQSKLDGETIKEMYSSDDRNEYANKMLTKLFDEQVAKRKITIPSDENVRIEAKNLLKETIFIH